MSRSKLRPCTFKFTVTMCPTLTWIEDGFIPDSADVDEAIDSFFLRYAEGWEKGIKVTAARSNSKAIRIAKNLQ